MSPVELIEETVVAFDDLFREDYKISRYMMWLMLQDKYGSSVGVSVRDALEYYDPIPKKYESECESFFKDNKQLLVEYIGNIDYMSYKGGN